MKYVGNSTMRKNMRVCPSCLHPFTKRELGEAWIPFSLKCKGCGAYIHELKVSLSLLIPGLLFALVMVELAEWLQEQIAPILPIIKEVPLSLIIVVCLGPLYYGAIRKMVDFTYKNGRFFVRKR